MVQLLPITIDAFIEPNGPRIEVIHAHLQTLWTEISGGTKMKNVEIKIEELKEIVLKSDQDCIEKIEKIKFFWWFFTLDIQNRIHNEIRAAFERVTNVLDIDQGWADVLALPIWEV